VDADFTRFDRTILAEYTVPWIFGKRIAMHMRGYSNRQNNPPFVEVGATLYQAKRDGIGVEWEYNAGLLRFGLSTGFEWQGIFDGMNSGCDIAKALDFDRDLMNKRFLYFVCAPHCQIRWLDDPVDPHAGFITFFSVKGMLNNDNKERLSFVKLLAEQTVFIPIIDPVVLALRMRVGHITSNFYRTILPSERFFLGGPSTIRGYEPDFVPPLGECLEEDICIPQGGKTMLNGNIEVRFPLNKWMQGVIFNDFGFLCKDACFDDKLLGATGAGLRLKSPLGIVRFDIGWKWRREIDQTPLAWYLTVGHAF
ncbi:MAG: BamA/TamA family outer membrane protein, partial [Candidatus Babeliales bacterium]